MKIYSEILDQLFDTVEQCEEAETAHKKAIEEAETKKKALANERATRAKEVEKLFKDVIDVQTEANAKTKEVRDKAYAALEAFCRDYGNFHCSVKAGEHLNLLDLFDIKFPWLF